MVHATLGSMNTVKSALVLLQWRPPEEQKKDYGDDQDQHHAMVLIVACCARTSPGRQSSNTQQHAAQGSQVGGQRYSPSHSPIKKERKRTQQQAKPTQELHDCGWNDERFVEPPYRDACVLN